MKFSFKKWAFVPALTLAAAFVGCNAENGEETPPAPTPGVEAPPVPTEPGDAAAPVDSTAPGAAVETPASDADMPAPDATAPAPGAAPTPDAAAPSADAAAPALEGPGDVKVDESPKPATDTPADAPKEDEKPADEPKP